MKKRELISVKFLFQLVVFFLFIVQFYSCADNNITVTHESDILNLPSLTEKDFRTEYTDSAELQIVMTSPLIERYTTVSPAYWEFLEGLNVKFYEGKPEPVAKLTAKYAKFHEDKNLWEFRDSVVAESDKKLETELLYWDRDKDLIYTERFVKITKEDETVMGTGFQSNSSFDNYIIKNTTMTIYR